MDGSLARASWIKFARAMSSFFICNVSTREKFTLNPLWKKTREIWSFAHTSKFEHSKIVRLVSCCRVQGIFKQIISMQWVSSKYSKTRELERRHSNSSHLMLTRNRWRLVRLLKGPSLDVGWKAQKRSLRYRSEFGTPSDKSEHGKLYFLLVSDNHSVGLRIKAPTPPTITPGFYGRVG